MTVTEEDVRAAVARAKTEILADMSDGVVPPDVDSFSRLHDYVDANEYGGLFEEPFYSERLLEETDTGIVNPEAGERVQAEVDRWLRAGRPDD